MINNNNVFFSNPARLTFPKNVRLMSTTPDEPLPLPGQDISGYWGPAGKGYYPGTGKDHP